MNRVEKKNFCRYGNACYTKECKYSHQRDIDCYFEGCTKIECNFRHSQMVSRTPVVQNTLSTKECRYKQNCRNMATCTFLHPNQIDCKCGPHCKEGSWGVCPYKHGDSSPVIVSGKYEPITKPKPEFIPNLDKFGNFITPPCPYYDNTHDDCYYDCNGRYWGQ